MKILYDHQIFKRQKFGGISRYFNELMKIENEGIEVGKINPNLIPNFSKPNLLMRGFRFIKRRAGLHIDQNEVLPARVTNKITNGNFDIFHPTYYDPYFLKLTSKPFVLTVYDMLHEIYPENFIVDQTSHNKKILCEAATQIITISDTTKDALLSLFKIPEEKVHTIHLASSFDKVTATKPDNLEGIENYILFTGVRSGYKNFNFAVRALSDILKSDRHLQFLCTGQEFNSDELNFFKELDIENQIKHIFLKNDNELSWVYQNARCFIFPSLYEGFGFPLLEAFACSCPVISSSGGSLKEIGGDGVIFFNPKNIREIQDATNMVLYNLTIRNSLIEKGKQEFNKYSWPICRSKTIELYRTIK